MRIWFNHWFSTAYHFINMTRDAFKTDGRDIIIIGTNERETCVYKENVDEFYVEPVFRNLEDYGDWCLEFCKEHKIDIFFVKRNMAYITQIKKEFDAINVKVVCEGDLDKFQTLNDKFKTMKLFEGLDIVNIPDMELVNTRREFEDAYDNMSKKHPRLCIKYNVDEGGQSYKLISERKPNIGRISENNGLVYTYDYICQCLDCVERFQDLIVMPYLNGVEISIDCLGLGDELLAIPRYKLNNRVTRLDLDESLIGIAKKIYNIVKLDMPFNIQLRYNNDKLYLLEINTRLSGGAWKDNYIGINFPYLAAKKLLGELDALPTPTQNKLDLSNIEGCQILHGLN